MKRNFRLLPPRVYNERNTEDIAAHLCSEFVSNIVWPSMIAVRMTITRMHWAVA